MSSSSQTAPQFIEYADTERPGIKLVSAKQVQVFLSDTTYGVVFFVTIHAVSPSLIITNPRLRCKFALGTSSPADGLSFPTTTPLQGPVVAKVVRTVNGQPQTVSQREYNFTSELTYPDGTSVTVPKSVDTNDVLPLKTLQGTIYFEVAKTKTQRVFSQEVEFY